MQIQNNKEKINKRLLDIINSAFSYRGMALTNADVNLPLCGQKINFSSSDMLCLYLIICKEFNVDLKVYEIEDFWSIDNISKLLSNIC